MEKSSTPQLKILVDADVLIHLFKADRISILKDLYPSRVFILDVVLDELKGNRTINNKLDSIMLFSGIKELIFPTTSNPTLFGEFLSLKKSIKGDDERASLIYCKYHSDIIASSNTKDIKPFCEQHGMVYLTTLDILCVAVHKNLMTGAEANQLIQKIIFNQESHLCCKSIEDHRKIHFIPLKISF
jgi:predicted nucleic acid-binding protein